MNEERRDYSSISKEIKDFVRDELNAHEQREKEWLEGVLEAFPERDVKGHRDYHENKIKAAKAEEEFWKVAREEFTRVGVSAIAGVIKVVAVLAIVTVAYKFGLGPTVAKLLGVGT
mgnify:CR=1 FL=1